MTKTVTALDTISGQVAQVPAIYLEKAYFGDHLVEVPVGTKSYDPEKYKPTDADGWRAKQTTQRKTKAAEDSKADASAEKTVD